MNPQWSGGLGSTLQTLCSGLNPTYANLIFFLKNWRDFHFHEHLLSRNFKRLNLVWDFNRIHYCWKGNKTNPYNTATNLLVWKESCMSCKYKLVYESCVNSYWVLHPKGNREVLFQCGALCQVEHYQFQQDRGFSKSQLRPVHCCL